MYYFEEETKKVDTTYEQHQMLWHLSYETFKWMLQSTGLLGYDTLDEAIKGLSEDCGDTYEVVVRFHLKNQMVIELHNRCFESVTNLDRFDGYRGDDILVRTLDGSSIEKYSYEDEGKVVLKPLVELNYFDSEGNFHQSILPISQVSYIDIYSIDLDWKELWSQLSCEEQERRRKLWLEYWGKDQGNRNNRKQ